MRRRTHTCGELRAHDAGKQVFLSGWVARIRDHGGLLFLDLRDRYGKTQVVIRPEEDSVLYEKASGLHGEWVISVEGEVALRPPGAVNRQISTGEVEVHARDIEVLNQCLPPPFPVEEEEIHPSEEMRLRYRYLDLRRSEMQEIFALRHRVYGIAREHLTTHGFLEIETPFLVKSTPEGARDYLVPSRVHPGKFYALPQSPQIYKQILMVAGFDRYFQIVRCFRDEDLRSDRQPEFTQVDVELSFPDIDTIFGIAESLFCKIFKAAWDVDLPSPFPRFTYSEVMAKYGTDKPDLRFGMPLVDVTEDLRDTDFRIVKEALEKDGAARGICVKGEAGRTRKQIADFEEAAKNAGLGGILPVKLTTEGVQGALAQHLSEATLRTITERMGAQQGDLLLFAVGAREETQKGLGALRLHLGETLGLIQPQSISIFWVTEFPLFEKDPVTGDLASAHHPFTGFFDEDIALLDTNPLAVRSHAYDMVVNGSEVLSGSIRISNPEVQRRIFSLLGINDEEATRRFGFLLEALRYGAPLMGGFAVGFDRVIMVLTGKSIRDVIAFPKTLLAASLMDGCPSEVDEKLLKDLYIQFVPPPDAK